MRTHPLLLLAAAAALVGSYLVVLRNWIGSGTNTLSGSSMAAPHVAGVAALYKASFGDAASSTIDNWIKANATAGVVKNVPAGTPNRLLYKAGL